MFDELTHLKECIDLAGIWYAQIDCGSHESDLWPYNSHGWREVTIPSTFEHCFPEHIGFQGVCWFEKRILVPYSMQGKRIILRFQAVNYHTVVWVNGKYAGYSDEGFLPFDIAITDFLDYGSENCITVRVCNRIVTGELPPIHYWRNQGGIIRKVELVAMGQEYIQNVRITAEPSGAEGRFTSSVFLYNELTKEVQAQVTVSVSPCGGSDEVLRLSQLFIMKANAVTEVMLKGLVPDALRWSPETPFLYRASVELTVEGKMTDSEAYRFGFRTICVKDGNVLLNGTPVFFSGFNRHEDYPDTRLAIDAAVAKRDLEEIKKAGANFVRMCHYPHNSDELDICDELGLLAMDEIPLCFLMALKPGKECEEAREALEESLDHAKSQLQRLIMRDFNHPSVIFWSVSNETNEREPGVIEINNTLIQLAKKTDPSRLAAHVSQDCYWTSDIQGRLFVHDDVICINEYKPLDSRRQGIIENYSLADAQEYWATKISKLAGAYPGKPVFVTEFGYQTGHWQDGAEDEEFQARVIEADYMGMRPYVCGALVWCYADHAWPLRWPDGFPICGRSVSFYGLVTRDRRKKRAFEAYSKLIRCEV